MSTTPATIDAVLGTANRIQPTIDTIPDRMEIKLAVHFKLTKINVKKNDNGLATAFTQKELTLLLFLGSDFTI